MRKLFIALLSLALTSSVGAQSCCDRDRAKRDAEGMFFPAIYPLERAGVGNVGTSAQLNAVGEKFAWCGYIRFADGATSKTITGGDPQASISFRTGAVTFADSATTPTNIRLGIMDIDATNGPPVRPDESDDVYADITVGDGTMDSSSDNVWISSVLMESGSAKTINTGTQYCVVFDMTARGAGATDDVIISAVANTVSTNPPSAGLKTGGTWATNLNIPNVIISFDDGVLGWFDQSMIQSAVATTGFKSDDAADEYVLICKADFDLSIRGFYGTVGFADGGSSEWNVYLDPEGSPTVATMTNGSAATITVDHDQQVASATARQGQWLLPTPTKPIRAGQKWAVGLKATATTANNNLIPRHTVSAAAHMAAYSGGTDCYQGTRADASGAFTATTTIRPFVGAIIDAVYTSR